MHCLFSLAFLPADDIIVALNELKLQMPQKASQLTD
jgi:type II secretory pathway component PulC